MAAAARGGDAAASGGAAAQQRRAARATAGLRWWGGSGGGGASAFKGWGSGTAWARGQGEALLPASDTAAAWRTSGLSSRVGGEAARLGFGPLGWAIGLVGQRVFFYIKSAEK